MTDKVAIRVHGVSKNFVLPHERVSSVKGLFMSALRGWSKSSETQHALNEISFEINKGEFFGIVGRNGSGKSTLLKIIAGIYQPTAGKVSLSGKLVPFIELGVGFNPELTGRENVYLNGAMLGFSRKEIESMYDDIVSFAEIGRFMDQKLKNYSSGMQVRLAFSMAIRAQADILLIDEVLAVGDADFQRKCFDYFKKLKRDKKTVVFVSHDMSALREYCDRAILIEKSRVVAEDSAEKIATKYTRMFIEEAKVNVSDGEKLATRWGTKTVVYDKTKSDVTEEYISLKLRATATQSVENPNFGFSIRDASGQVLVGTNTRIKNHKVISLTKGENISLIWGLPNIFKDGKYSVDLAILGGNGETFDWWEDAISFSVLKEERTPYLINPKINLKVDLKA